MPMMGETLLRLHKPSGEGIVVYTVTGDHSVLTTGKVDEIDGHRFYVVRSAEIECPDEGDGEFYNVINAIVMAIH